MSRELCHLLDRVHVQVSEVRRDVDGDDGDCSDDDGARQVALRVLDLAACEGQIREAVIGPQHGDQGQPIQPRLHCCAGRCEIRERRAAVVAEKERKEHQRRQGAEFRDRRQACEQCTKLDADDIDRGGKGDSARREVIRPRGMGRRVVPEHAQEVLAKYRGNAAERGGANQHDLSPPVEKRVRPPPSFAQVDVHTAGLWHRCGQLGECQRAAEDHQSTNDPHRKHPHRFRHARRDAGRRAKDTAADGDADDEAD